MSGRSLWRSSVILVLSVFIKLPSGAAAQIYEIAGLCRKAHFGRNQLRSSDLLSWRMSHDLFDQFTNSTFSTDQIVNAVFDVAAKVEQ
jgi:hypothetical protein